MQRRGVDQSVESAFVKDMRAALGRLLAAGTDSAKRRAQREMTGILHRQFSRSAWDAAAAFDTAEVRCVPRDTTRDRSCHAECAVSRDGKLASAGRDAD